MHAPPRPMGRGKGLCRRAPTRKKEALPRPVKITKTCGVQRGHVDFNSLKFGRIQFCRINFCRKDPILSDKFLPQSQISWFTHFFAPHRPPRGLKAPPRASLVKSISRLQRQKSFFFKFTLAAKMVESLFPESNGQLPIDQIMSQTAGVDVNCPRTDALITTILPSTCPQLIVWNRNESYLRIWSDWMQSIP